MSVVVAHLPSATGHLALREGARQAVQRHVPLVVVQVTDGVDLDTSAAHEAGLSDEIGTLLAETDLPDLDWSLQLAAAPDEVDLTVETILEAAADAGAELLVIGARRRSPVGKFLLGSVTQKLILEADMPVLVVKSDA